MRLSTFKLKMKQPKFSQYKRNAFIFVIVLIIPWYNCQEQQPGQQPRGEIEWQNSSASVSELNPPALQLHKQTPISVSYFKASIPMRIYECLREFSTLRCTKLYLLQKMEEGKTRPNTGNITKDFLNQFFGDDEQMDSLISDRYKKMTDKDLNKQLVLYFQRFFKNRNIKLHFVPGLTVKIIPSKENKLKFSMKKNIKHNLGHQARSQSIGIKGILQNTGFGDSSIEGQENISLDEDEMDIKSKHKDLKKIKKPKKNKTSYKTTILQMAVPVMIMPAILMGTFLPFILPVLKMATLTTLVMNNAAFLAALIYAARTHVNAQDEQTINYNYPHPSFH